MFDFGSGGTSSLLIIALSIGALLGLRGFVYVKISFVATKSPITLAIEVFHGLRRSLYVPVLYFSRSAEVKFPIKKAKGLNEISLRAFIDSKCPSLSEPFIPAWWLFNGHLQTLYSVIGDFSSVDKVVYHRQLLRLMDGGTLGLDFTPANADSYDVETPIIVVLHGLTGGSYESYVRSVIAPACTQVNQGGLGYRAVVVNFRGCAGTPVTSPRRYSGAHTDDLRQALFYIAHKFPQAPLLGLGFSLGAHVLTRYLGEEGEKSRLMSGCILGCPWDLVANNERITSTFLGRHVYSKGMGKNMQMLIKRHYKPLTKDPDSLMAKQVIATLALKNPRLDEIDDSWTRFVGSTSPNFPFGSKHDYYVYTSCHRAASAIRVPFLTINAADDPIVRSVPVDAVGHGWGVMIITGGGGHLGWFEAGEKAGEVTRWIRKPILEWLKAVGECLVHDKGKCLPLHKVDGFLKEVGRDDIGCKEVEEEARFIVGADGQEGIMRGL